MLLDTFRKWTSLVLSPVERRGRPPKRIRSTLSLETLQPRLTPVSGAFAVPPPIDPGTGYDGVVSLGNCTGSLLYSGRHILTAAHCVDPWTGRDGIPGGPVSVTFEMASGDITMAGIPPSSITIHPSWGASATDPTVVPIDMAIITLPEIAPAGAERYQLYRSFDEDGRVFSFAGYGTTGTGLADGPDFFDGRKRLGWNRVDGAGGTLGADFDSGSSKDNVTGDLGLGASEAMINFGDSGGPAFLDGRIAGVTQNIIWDGDSSVDFGATGYWARVSTAASWIDARLAGSYSLVVDMNRQPEGNDGDSDVIQLRLVGDRLQLLIDGAVVHEDAASNITSVTIRGSSDQDVVSISSVLGVNVTVDGRGGDDRLVGPYFAAGVNWEITGVNAGRIDPLPLGGASFTFSSMENLIGASSRDTFLFSNGMSVSGSIDGGYGGDDKLHYGAYTTTVNVDLSAGSATGVAAGTVGRVFGIEDVTGGFAADLLIGDDFVNRLRGGGNDDVMYGRGGNDYLYGDGGHDRLFGEYGLDHLYGGWGNDLLDGGHDHLADVLQGDLGIDTFVDHQHWRAVYELFDPLPKWKWVSEDLFADFNALEDRKNIAHWLD